MAEKIILRRKQTATDWKWKVKVRTKQREIPLSKVNDPGAPPSATPPMVEFLQDDTNTSQTTPPTFYIKFIGKDYGAYGADQIFWYKISNTIAEKGEFKIRLQSGIIMVRDMTIINPGNGKPGGPWECLEQISSPTIGDPSKVSVKAEVHDENPRWVKIGTRWYYIG